MRALAGAGGLVGPHLQAFFAEHLLAHKRASPQTIACYRDTFRLLLRFMRQRTGAEPAVLPLAALDADAVLAFLDHLERDRRCSVRSRNTRLAAIRSFFRLVALRVPDNLGQVTRVMAIPVKRCDKRLVGYLSRDEVKALLAAPDRSAWSGRRDHALLLTLYNSGARLGDHRVAERAGAARRRHPRPPRAARQGPQGPGRAALGGDRPGAAGMVARAGQPGRRRRVPERPRPHATSPRPPERAPKFS